MHPLTRALVWKRAKSRCEHCRIRQKDDHFYRFQIEHVRPRKHGGSSALSNLALACWPCNGHKGPNLTGIDPVTRRVVALFNPRRNSWNRHFRWEGPLLFGRTPKGRVTVDVLGINLPDRVALRQFLKSIGQWRPT